jgi:hypothetical protein
MRTSGNLESKMSVPAVAFHDADEQETGVSACQPVSGHSTRAPHRAKVYPDHRRLVGLEPAIKRSQCHHHIVTSLVRCRGQLTARSLQVRAHLTGPFQTLSPCRCHDTTPTPSSWSRAPVPPSRLSGGALSRPTRRSCSSRALPSFPASFSQFLVADCLG